MSIILLLSFLPRLSPSAEIAHDLGANKDLRGSIKLSIDLSLFETSAWGLELYTQTISFVRENRAEESPVRISPQQIHYPVGARLSLPQGKGRSLFLFAHHQSNHDIDTEESALIVETLSYEWYGLGYQFPGAELRLGFLYDRGTRLSGRHQLLPFDHYYAGLSGAWERRFEAWFLRLEALLIIHAKDDQKPSWLNLDGSADLGYLFQGERGCWRLFLRLQRLEDYQHLSDDPEHMLLLGSSISG